MTDFQKQLLEAESKALCSPLSTDSEKELGQAIFAALSEIERLREKND